MLEKKEREIIERFISGKADETDIIWFENEISSGVSQAYLRQRIKEDWDTIENSDNIDVSFLLDRIHHIIHKKEQQQNKKLLNRALRLYTKVAAAILIPLLMAGVYYYRLSAKSKTVTHEKIANSTISAPLGSRVSFNLPDGSNGFLNSGSSISFPVPFINNRNILLQGEAWFDVAENNEVPFNIKAGNSIVRVLGTRFNVNAPTEAKVVEVVLETGHVEFLADKSGKPVVLEPSSRLLFKDQAISVSHVDPEKYKGWTEGKLIFRGDSMDEVVHRISRWYNVEVQIADEELKEYVFHGTFQDDSLREVLKLLSMTSPLKYKFVQRKRLSDGTWEKERIILTKRK